MNIDQTNFFWVKGRHPDNIYARKNSLKKHFFYSEDGAWEVIKKYDAEYSNLIDTISELVDTASEQDKLEEDENYILLPLEDGLDAQVLSEAEYESFIEIYRGLGLDESLFVLYKKA